MKSTLAHKPLEQKSHQDEVTQRKQQADSDKGGASAGVPIFLRRQPLEEEEEMIQPKLQRQPLEEEEEMIQPKLQRQPLEEEEEMIQPKLQRQPLEEEEEMIQPKLQLQPLEKDEVQPSLNIGEPDDEYEREADQVADTVMRMPTTQADKAEDKFPGSGIIQRKKNLSRFLQRMCFECEEEQAKTKSHVQAKAVSNAGGQSSKQVASTIKSPPAGVALKKNIKSRIEPVIGHDLGHVRVHQDLDAQQAAASINAKAFTHQNQIYLGKGESDQDLGLMAHEATHVVQQQGDMVHPKFEVPAIQRNMDAGVPDAAVADAGAGPTDAGVELPAGVPAPAPPAPTGPDACDTAEEEARKNAFRLRFFSRTRFQPSSGFGMFDAYYLPMASLMMVITKIKMNFIQADNTPDPFTLAMMIFNGQDITPFFWSEAEKEQYKRDFISRITARWSLQHTLRSTKPCWPFSANPVVTPMLVDTTTAAHFPFTIHKSPPATIEYKSAINWTRQASGNWEGEGQLYQSDVQEESDFNSEDVARAERKRIDRAIAAASASPILFGHNSAVIPPAEQTKLRTLASALKAKNPSDPAIPIKVDGFASMEGSVGLNNRLSQDRADAVADLLRAEGVPQPVGTNPGGPIGAPNDAANRKAVIKTDSTFETSYSSNRYSVAEHEFGHTLGLPDEYLNNLTGPLGTWQSGYDALARTAGVAPPDRWGEDTSSQMSNGVDVLPRHYLTLWEALGAMTAPDINRDEWSID